MGKTKRLLELYGCPVNIIEASGLVSKGGIAQRDVRSGLTRDRIRTNGWDPNVSTIQVIEVMRTPEQWRAYCNSGVNNIKSGAPMLEPLHELFGDDVKGVEAEEIEGLVHRIFWAIDGNHRITHLKELIVEGHAMKIDKIPRGVLLWNDVYSPELLKTISLKAMECNLTGSKRETDTYVDKVSQVKQVGRHICIRIPLPFPLPSLPSPLPSSSPSPLLVFSLFVCVWYSLSMCGEHITDCLCVCGTVDPCVENSQWI
jgi:hypothetical protein